ncbi:MAG: hypothetical protein WCP16_08100 [Pseudanabaena sp. ELA645]
MIFWLRVKKFLPLNYTFMLNWEVRCSDWLLAKIKQAKIFDFDVQFRKIIGDRRDKKL